MLPKPFLWVYPDGRRKRFSSRSEAARVLGVSESVIRYYIKHNIHCDSDKKWQRKTKKAIEEERG